MAVGALRDGTPVIVSGSRDRTVRMWRLTDGAPLGSPLWLTGPVVGIAMHGTIVVTAAGANIGAHLPAFLGPVR